MFLFEFDERKSQSNLTKHGIDFMSAQELWSDPNLVEIPARTIDEQRFFSHRLYQGQALVGSYRAQEQEHPNHLCSSSPTRRGSYL